MFGGLQAWRSRPARASFAWLAALTSIALLAACSGNLPDLEYLASRRSSASSYNSIRVLADRAMNCVCVQTVVFEIGEITGATYSRQGRPVESI